MGASTAASQMSGEGVAELCAYLGPAGDAQGALGPALARLDFVAALPNAAAPSYVYFAGSCLGTAVGGGGATALEAAGRLAGEAAEVLALAGNAPAASGNDGGARLHAIDLVSNESTSIERHVVLSGPGEPPPDLPLGLGLAAGTDSASARLAGLLELVERDAAARWWNEGVLPRQPDSATLAEATDMLAGLRGRVPKRATTLLALTGAAGIPVICALSCGQGGSDLAFGLKAASDPAAAARGAIIECLQMEIALDLARLRAERGTPAAADADVLARANLDPDGFATFAARPAVPAAALSGDLDALVARLATAGHRPVAVDLPEAPPGFAVARIVAPSLRPLPARTPGRPGTPGAVAKLI